MGLVKRDFTNTFLAFQREGFSPLYIYFEQNINIDQTELKLQFLIKSHLSLTYICMSPKFKFVMERKRLKF